MSKVKVTGTKKRIHTMAATTTDSPYGGHSCFTNSPCCYSFSLIRHSTFLTLDYFLLPILHISVNMINYLIHQNNSQTRAVCKTCMPPIWIVSCSGSHCVNTFFVTVSGGGGGGNHFTVLSHRDL